MPIRIGFFSETTMCSRARTQKKKTLGHWPGMEGSVHRVDWRPMWGFPKIGGTFLGVPIMRIIVFWSPPFRETTMSHAPHNQYIAPEDWP